MEIVAGAASLTQLSAYAYSTTRRLIDLYKAAQEGPSFCREQSCNIRFLLRSIQRICSLEAPDTDSLLPLLISIADLSSSILNLLGPTGALRNKWLWVSKSRQFEEAFQALGEKTNLLQLCIAERTYTLVGAISRNSDQKMNANRSTGTPSVRIPLRCFAFLHSHRQPLILFFPYISMQNNSWLTITCSDQKPKVGSSPNTTQSANLNLRAENNKTSQEAEMNVGGGWGKSSNMADIKYDGNTADGGSKQNFGNA